MAKTGIFTERMNRHEEELRGIYEELYHNGEQYERLKELMKEAFTKRSAALKALDRNGSRRRSGTGKAGCWASPCIRSCLPEG